MSPPLTSSEYRLLVRHSPVMIWRSGLDALCDYFNETWLAFTGRTMDQEIGNGWAEGVHPDDFDRCVAHYLDHFHRREAFEMEYRLRRHDGEDRWIFDRGVPFTTDAGVFAGYIGSCVDVDERRRAQDAQQQHNQEQLALAQDFEKWILAIVSHDIRDPLGTILFATRRLQDVADPTGVAKTRRPAHPAHRRRSPRPRAGTRRRRHSDRPQADRSGCRLPADHRRPRGGGPGSADHVRLRR
jgi:two-component system CheB/CheR fusion protein